MIVVRNIFRLKFGQARPAIALWKEGVAIMSRIGPAGSPRVLTDLVGPAYTLVFENTYASLSDFEQAMRAIMGNDEWRSWYQKFVPLAESGHREILNVVE